MLTSLARRAANELYPINGAVQKVGKNDTAFSFRDANFAEVIVGVDPDPANGQRMMPEATTS